MRVNAAERRDKAWALRKRGYSFRDIADTLKNDPTAGPNYSKSQAQRDVQKVLDDLQTRTINSAAEERALDLARLDDLLMAWFAPAVGLSDAEAIGRHGVASAEAIPAEAESAEQAALEAVLTAVAGGPSQVNALAGGGPVRALDKAAADVVLKALERRAKMLGLDRQELALATPTPLAVVVGAADLSGLGEAELDAVIRNLSAALSAGHD